MPFNYNIHPSNELFKPSDDMWFSGDARKINSKRQSSLKSAKESSARPQSYPCPRDQNKLKSKSNFDPCHEAKLDTLGEIFRRESVNGSSTQHDELVKHMSNLPSFLKGSSDRGKNIQGKALNVGVLDWSRLEKWKNKSSEESSSSSRAATTSSTTTRGHKKHGDRKGSRSSSVKGSYKEGLTESSKQHSQNVKRYQHSETEIRTLGDELRMTAFEFQSIGKTHLDKSLQKEKSDQDNVRNFASESTHHGVSLVPNENSNGWDFEAQNSMGGLKQHCLKKRERNLNSISHKGLPSLESKYKGSSFGSQNKMSSKAKKNMDEVQETDFDVGYKQYRGMPSNIVLLRPRKFLESSSEDYFQLSQSRTSSDEIFSESSQSSSSYVSLYEEVYTEDVSSEASHLSVLHSVTNLASSRTTEHTANADLDHSSHSNEMSSLTSEDNCIEKDISDIKLRNQCSFTNMNEPQDHETAEQTTLNAWNSSSQPRLGFGLNRIGRSFSFKESSTLPKHSSKDVSAKSGPLTFEPSGYLDNSKIDKATGHNRTRSYGSFRRLLDPILKHKASNIHHSAECSPARSMNLPAEKGKESSIQAFLQLTIKNGLPLFKFVINSERKVLAATMKSLEKDGVGCYFTFYLVNEIKKKGGKWVNHWNKEKNCGYEYKVVGQMKISSSRITESSDQTKCVEKDYVLFSVDVDQGPPDFTKSKELAAVVMETPCEDASHEGLYSDNLQKMGCLKCLEDEICFCSSQEIDIPGRITVILPGGVHSSPSKGEPSPLIHRWKMGGICDCGGWDVGCKLLGLSNKYHSSNVPRSLKSYLERFQLFVQVYFYYST